MAIKAEAGRKDIPIKTAVGIENVAVKKKKKKGTFKEKKIKDWNEDEKETKKEGKIRRGDSRIHANMKLTRDMVEREK